jgi:hypothetical protein
VSEPRSGEIYQAYETRQSATPTRAVTVVISPDWAQVLTRMQQLYNEGCTLVRLLEDGQGRIRVEPDN